MSNIYIQEPPTIGKVLMNTSVGDIDIELWSKEAPKACRNFVQLCLEGYYDNTIFHRIVKDSMQKGVNDIIDIFTSEDMENMSLVIFNSGFCIQGGDPTGTGTGGDSIYGQPFKDEIHQRLRFVRRGLVAMANAGQNDNASQFFFTLGRADELNGKHTIFGKVTGNTIYNMLEMESLEVDKNDYPTYPPTIYKTEVLSNPFEDIVPRKKLIPTGKQNETLNKKEKITKGTKNFSLLSFGEEAEEDEQEVHTLAKDIKIKSSHDVLNDPKLSSVPALDTSDSKDTKHDGENIADDVRSKLQKPNVEVKNDDGENDDTREEMSDRKKELMKESKRLQRELREGNKRKNEREKDEKEDDVKEDKKDEGTGAVKEFRQERKEFLHRKNEQIKKKGSGRQEQTMKLLSGFQSKLENMDDQDTSNVIQLNDPEDEDEEDVNDMSWLHHKLVFEDQEHKVKDANVHDEDTYEMFDPRNPINKRRREESKKRQTEKRKK